MSTPDDPLETLFKEITSANSKIYFRGPIPCALDETISQFVNLFRHETPAGRRRIRGMMNNVLSYQLKSFTERMASLGVRERSRERLMDGLVALLMEPYFGDVVNNNISMLAMLYDAGLKIDIDANELFLEAASVVSNGIAIDMIEFTKRTPANRKLESFFYSEGSDTDGFRYKGQEIDKALFAKLGIDLDD